MTQKTVGTGLIPPHVKKFIDWAAEDTEGFWNHAAEQAMGEIKWFKKWDQAFKWEYPTFKWFVGGQTNISYSCLDYNIEKGRAGRTAIVVESGETGETGAVTYAQLFELVKKYARALRGIGVQKGDRIAVYMPTSVESVATMLACARVGAIHVVIFAGFSSSAVADRLQISGAKYVIAQAEGSRRGKPVGLKPIVDEGIAKCPADLIKKVVVLKKNDQQEYPMVSGRDIDWEEFLAGGEGQSDACEIMDSNEPLFLLPTSGTTAKPKVTVQKHGGYQIYVYSMSQWVYGLQESDVWFCTSDIGWIVGHSYNVYGPLLNGCTTVLYEGTPDYPNKDMWWSVASRNKATALWLSPTGVRALMRFGTGEARKHDLSSVQRIFCAGEVLNPPAWSWLQEEVFENRIPVMDHMWQTETSGPIFANPYGLGIIPIKPGSAHIPVPGVVAEVLDEKEGKVLPPNEKGVVVIKKPFPGLVSTLWGDEEGYLYNYWERLPVTKGKYLCGDAAYFDEDGYIYFAGRSDEVIKIAAHRIGTVEVESALISHPAVVESGVSGVPDELRGEVACAFVVLKGGYEPSEELKKELIAHVRNTMGAIVVMRDIQFVGTLPKTRSGKIMRRVMKTLWLGNDLGDLSTIEEAASIDEIKDAISKMKD
ncbi:acetyl-CoA synthetase [Desulfotomaculum arcticum]|uniref:Acetyl-CoA synthetase n=1 Tax=Desulfotruncus arcticus DSM 17038 TaxID=1121424 RepID=A0A1I2R9D6_9FIRM|nr:acetate--CoA ligase [Desulfotruncus arcticus]SFG37072.1 acetyl-CoA synthetase [Desulfotomaculum arcticum] [Desulfotruncus arcticus DSM 17038]